MAAGTITDIAFDIFPVISSADPYRDFTVKMGCTSLSELTSFQSNLQVVMVDPSFRPAGIGFNTHNFNMPYDWDGVSNLLIEICYDNPDVVFPDTVGSLSDLVRSTNMGYNCVVLAQADAASGCNLNSPSSQIFTYQVRPNLRFVYCEAPVRRITYSWAAGTNLFNTDSLNPFAVVVENSTYYLTANDSFCTSTGSLALSLHQFDYTLSADAEICKGTSAQLAGTGPYAYVWQPAATLSCDSCPNPVSTPDRSLTYYIQITDTTHGCLTSDSVSVDVQALSVAFPSDTIRIDLGESATLQPTVSGGNGTFVYDWSPSDYLDDTTSSTPVSNPSEDILYSVSVVSGICKDSASVYLQTIIPETKVILPNAFSPNADGQNDTFYPLFTGPDATVASFRIYNRYGELVHNSASAWDGRLRGAMQPAGTFIYYLEVELPDSKTVKRQGEVTLLH